VTEAPLPRGFFEIAERDHEIQNPTSAEKIRLLGERLRLSAESRVLDVAAGRCGPAVVLASTFGCRIEAIELREAFVDAARARITDAGLQRNIELVHADARELSFKRDAYDAALCLGASFVWDGLNGTLEALAPAVRNGGHVVVGEPYWRTWPLPDGYPGGDDGYTTLGGTVTRFASAGLQPTTLIASSDDDWDAYESLHWRSFEEWLAENAGHEDADAIRARHEQFRDHYVGWQRAFLGWAIFVARKP
jgi:precorrin-6B methylase 2